MTCPNELELSIYADGELSDDEARAIEAHLDQCKHCLALLEATTLQNTSLREAFLEEERMLEVPPLLEPRARRSWAGLASVVAAAAATPLLIEMAWRSLPSLPEGFGWLADLGGFAGLVAVARALFDRLLGGEGMWISTFGFAATTLVVVGALAITALRQRAALPALVGALAMWLGVFAAPSQALAEEVRSERNGRVEVAASETLDDTVILQGKTAIVAGIVNGDVIAAGNRVEIAGTVRGNVYAAGETVTISGTVEGNVHLAGTEVDVDGKVGGSALLAGQSVLVTQRGHIGRTAYLAGESVRLKGRVGRALYVGARRVEISGHVQRLVRGGAERFALASGATLGGDLHVTVPSRDAVEIDAKASIGGSRRIEVRALDERNDLLRPGYYFGLVTRTIALLLFGTLLVALFPRLSPPTPRSTVAVLRTLGLGFVALVATPFAIVVLGLTVIGIPLAILVAMAYALIAYLSTLVAAYFLAQRWPVLDQTPLALRTAITLAALLFVSKIPLVGPGLGFLVCLFGVGTLVAHLRSLYGRGPVDRSAGSATAEIPV